MSRSTGMRALFASRRSLILFFLGFSSGFPYIIPGQLLKARLRDGGVDLATLIGLSSAYLPYTFKFLVAPLLDRYPPFILGRRRGWILTFQLLLVAAISWLALQDAKGPVLPIVVAAWMVTTCSALQDIVIDAYSAELLSPEERAGGIAASATGYRLGVLVVGTGALLLADFIDWRVVYLALAVIMAGCLVTTFLAEEPPRPPGAPASLAQAVGRPLAELFTRSGVAPILLFIVLYKFGDYLASTAGGPIFFNSVGFEWAEIALMNKLVAFFSGLVGALMAAPLLKRYGVWKMLLFFGGLQAVTNCLYVLLVRYHESLPAFDPVALGAHGFGPGSMVRSLFDQAVHHRSFALFGLSVFCDNAANTMGAVAFTTFLFSQVRKEYSATQYSLFTGLSSLGQNVFFFLAVPIVKAGYGTFYVVTAAMAIPGLLVGAWLMRRQERAEKDRQASDRARGGA